MKKNEFDKFFESFELSKDLQRQVIDVEENEFITKIQYMTENSYKEFLKCVVSVELLNSITLLNELRKNSYTKFLFSKEVSETHKSFKMTNKETVLDEYYSFLKEKNIVNENNEILVSKLSFNKYYSNYTTSKLYFYSKVLNVLFNENIETYDFVSNSHRIEKLLLLQKNVTITNFLTHFINELEFNNYSSFMSDKVVVDVKNNIFSRLENIDVKKLKSLISKIDTNFYTELQKITKEKYNVSFVF